MKGFLIYFLSLFPFFSKILGFLFLFFLIIGAWAGFSFAPFVPTKKRDLERIFQRADLKKGEKVYELGFGDGRFILEAVKRYKVKGVGIEINPFFYLFVWIKRFFLEDKKNLILKWGNLFKENLSEADVVYFWGMPNTLEKLKKKLERELKPGTRVISYVFEIKGWKPNFIDRQPKEVPIFFYQKE